MRYNKVSKSPRSRTLLPSRIRLPLVATLLGHSLSLAKLASSLNEGAYGVHRKRTLNLSVENIVVYDTAVSFLTVSNCHPEQVSILGSKQNKPKDLCALAHNL